ncbi:7981_t:CDS:2 [Acaulospora colombiana]|uniref:7981_t:CDS:1 n=1 Tax=Acaulospora colombiana TaxID=27376 RepID=A0ACA9NH41_9GLOM|nr:7981_t:CDS:2 [Acaulospora colombiana]
MAARLVLTSARTWRHSYLMDSYQKPRNYRIGVLGDFKVGKTSIIERAHYNHGVVLVQALCLPTTSVNDAYSGSLDNLEALMENILKIQRVAPFPIRGTLVGNKCDLVEQRAVGISLAKEFAEKYALNYIETSAKASINVETLILGLVKQIVETTRIKIDNKRLGGGRGLKKEAIGESIQLTIEGIRYLNRRGRPHMGLAAEEYLRGMSSRTRPYFRHHFEKNEYLMDHHQYPYNYRIIVLGGFRVGKTSIIERSVDDAFWTGGRPAINFDFRTQLVKIEGKVIKIQLVCQCHNFDTNSFKRGASESFNTLGRWMEEIKRIQTLAEHPMPGTLQQPIHRPHLNARQEFAEKHELDYIETSAKESINVETLVLTLVKRIMET